MRLLFAALLTFTFALLSACADDKKEPAKDAPKSGDPRAEKFQAIKSKFEEEKADVVKRFQAAKGDDRAKVRTEAKEIYVLAADKALKIAAENPKDETGLDAAVLAVEALLTFRVTGDDMDKAVKIITENHLDSPKIKSLVRLMAQAGEPGQAFLKAVAEKATDKEVKGVALYTLGSALAEQADEMEDEKKAQAASAEAIGYLERAAKEAGDVKYGRGSTIGKMAEEELVALRTLGVGKPVPDAEGTDLKTGHKMKLSGFKGKVVLLDVWATWCGPCKAMIPHEREMVKKFDGKPFILVSVSADDDKKALQEFLDKTEMPWTHWWDGQDSSLIKTFRIKAFPTLYLIDDKGVIRKKFMGSPGNEVLDKAVEELVKEAGKG